MAVILFDMFPAQGHYNGSFAVARLLKSTDHKVVYACPADFQEKIMVSGFQVYLFNPFIIVPFSLELKEKGRLRFMMENLAAMFTHEKSGQIDRNVKKYDEMIEKINPDLIILDEHYAYKSIFYWKYKIPVVTIQTAISPDYAPGIPPFYHPAVPDFSEKNKLYIDYLWVRHSIKNRIRRLFNSILTMGITSEHYYKKYARKYEFPYHKKVKRRAVGIRFTHIPAMVVPPESFDFPRKVKNNLFYIGLLNHVSIPRDMISKRLERVFEETAEAKKRNGEARLAYCSLGTITGNYLKVCRKFFREIAEVCRRNHDFHIILSVGNYFDISEIGETPDNLYVFNRVPQLEVLEKCDYVITHGGMNTTFESIMAEKPMIVFPLSMDWDQNGNAARIVYHGIGLKGVLRSATPRTIERLLRTLKTSEKKYKENIRQLKSKFEDRSAYTLDLIDNFIKTGLPC